MRALNIVGFKNTGKTALTLALAQTLEKRGLQVALVKQSHHELDKAHTDTGRFRTEGYNQEHGKSRTVLALGQGETALFWGEQKKLPDLLHLIEADIILIEGAKSQDFLPRILCLGPQDDSAHLAPELQEPLALATYSMVQRPQGGVDGKAHYTDLTPENLEALATLVSEHAFALPRLDCKSCGFPSCAHMARTMVEQALMPESVTKTKNCPILEGKVQLHINGRNIALNPFTARVMAGALQGMVHQLKGVPTSSQEQELTFTCTL